MEFLSKATEYGLYDSANKIETIGNKGEVSLRDGLKALPTKMRESPSFCLICYCEVSKYTIGHKDVLWEDKTTLLIIFDEGT